MVRTYNDIYIRTRRALKEAGVEAYGLEARLMAAHAADKSVAQLMRDLPLYAAPDMAERVEDMLARRLAGEPVAYITGSWEFYGVPLDITPDVLIPRVDTEVMAEAAVALFRGQNGRPRILDLCAGSGCIGCALAVHMPGARVVLADNDPKALRVCRRNVQKNGLDGRVLWVEADAAKKPPMLLGRFDLVVCNAPYVPTGELADLDSSVRDYEPYAALDGGEDGLDIIRPVIALWRGVLRPGGTMMLEIGEDQASEVMEFMAQWGFTGVELLQDTAGHDRVVVGRLDEDISRPEEAAEKEI